MSVPLPVNQRRISISAVEKYASDYHIASKKISKTKSKQFQEVWKKSEAVKMIETFVFCFKNKLHQHLDYNEEARILAQFDEICIKVISKLKNSQSRSDLFNKISLIFKKIFTKILFENPLMIRQPKFSLNQEDFQIAEMSNYNEYVINKRVLYCYDYVFYQLNEVKAFPYIFNSESCQWPTNFFTDSKKFLAGWGYEEVEEPFVGDLVLYSHEGVAKHFGIWTHEGNVLSKFGMSVVVKHPIDDVFLGYGDDVFFFRKRLKSLLLEHFISDLNKAYQSSSSFSHPVMASPLTTRGCVKKTIDIFEKMQISKVFKNCIYNIDYNNALQSEILLKLKIYLFAISEMTLKAEAISIIAAIVFSVSDRTEGKI